MLLFRDRQSRSASRARRLCVLAIRPIGAPVERASIASVPDPVIPGVGRRPQLRVLFMQPGIFLAQRLYRAAPARPDVNLTGHRCRFLHGSTERLRGFPHLFQFIPIPQSRRHTNPVDLHLSANAGGFRSTCSHPRMHTLTDRSPPEQGPVGRMTDIRRLPGPINGFPSPKREFSRTK